MSLDLVDGLLSDFPPTETDAAAFL
ncbi:MAG: hypothetical protein K0S92_276, partial [Desertimonas sp.]|nr:hypothetical protein [Desertimonas sp.]